MRFVRLHDLSKTALIAFSFASAIAACSSADVSADPVTDDGLTKAPLPNPGSPSAPGQPSGSADPNGPTEGAPADEGGGEDTDDDGAPSTDDGAPNGGGGSKDAGAPKDGSGSDTGTPIPSPTRLRGTNLVGMEGGWDFNQTTGPAPDKDYAVHSTKIIDYLVSKRVDHIRFLFSWERIQSTLGGSIPGSGNYRAYHDDYKRIVDYATAKGMTVVLAPWQLGSSGGAGGARWRGNLVGSGTVTSAHFADFWSKMATIYANNPRVAISLVNEPNNMGTVSWFGIAQGAITAIRKAGFKGEVYVPGNGWTAAHSWNDTWYDTSGTKRSNAYGWMNARGPGLPLSDPLGKLVVEVHTYADSDASGSSTGIVSTSTTRSRVKVVTDWARANKLKVWLGEVGMYASATNAKANWNDFVSYMDASSDTLLGFAWWACGKPGWWNDVAANGGGHFSITPTNDYKTDTVNMDMIEGSFLE